MPVSAAAPSSGDCGSVKPTPFLPGPPLPSSTLQEEPPNLLSPWEACTVLNCGQQSGAGDGQPGAGEKTPYKVAQQECEFFTLIHTPRQTEKPSQAAPHPREREDTSVTLAPTAQAGNGTLAEGALQAERGPRGWGAGDGTVPLESSLNTTSCPLHDFGGCGSCSARPTGPTGPEGRHRAGAHAPGRPGPPDSRREQSCPRAAIKPLPRAQAHGAAQVRSISASALRQVLLLSPVRG